MHAVVRVRPGQNQKHGTVSESPTWGEGTQVLEQVLGTLAGGWIRSGAAENQTSTPMWDVLSQVPSYPYTTMLGPFSLILCETVCQPHCVHLLWLHFCIYRIVV